MAVSPRTRLLTALVFVFALSANSDPMDHWQPRNLPPAGDLYAVAYGNNTFVAAGYAGAMATSPDGIHWTRRDTPAGYDDIYGVAFGNGVFVSAAYGSGIMSSVNGFEWTPRATNFTGFEALAFAGGKFFAMGYRLAVSTDGTNWSAGGTNSFYLADIAFGKGLYVAVRGDENIETSYDGVNWQVQSTPVSRSFQNRNFV